MTNETLGILLSWAAMLSGFPLPDYSLTVEYVPHEFFVEHVCGGKECDVLGSYLDADAPEVVYIDEKYRDSSSMFARSLIVHEAVHALQWNSGQFDSDNCEHSLIRERQSYFVQNEYLVRNGHAPILRMVHGVCRVRIES